MSRAGALAYAVGREARRRRHGATPVKVGCPVISVGSVQAGGAGKTPLAIAVANTLASRGRQAGVVLLGSGGRSGWRPRTYAPGSSPPPEVVGDEAALVAKMAPRAVLAVGRDRTAGAQALAAGGVEVVVLEDGMQWSTLARDLELVAVGVGRGAAAAIPLGRLREWPSAYARADLLLTMPGANLGVLRRWAGGIPVLPWVVGPPTW
ncbi:tetraacyldisaccharide 4'-kinase, partial [bacterium]|nr:tetraacyldisaccharide 4'-kinase [bacterium]